MNRRPRVLCALNLDLAPDALALVREVADVDYRPDADSSYLREHIGDYEAFWGHFTLPIDADVIARADRLRVVVTGSTGTDHIDKLAAAERGIDILSIKDRHNRIQIFRFDSNHHALLGLTDPDLRIRQTRILERHFFQIHFHAELFAHLANGAA